MRVWPTGRTRDLLVRGPWTPRVETAVFHPVCIHWLWKRGEEMGKQYLLRYTFRMFHCWHDHEEILYWLCRNAHIKVLFPFQGSCGASVCRPVWLLVSLSVGYLRSDYGFSSPTVGCSGRPPFTHQHEMGHRGAKGRKPNTIKISQPRNPFTWRLKTQTSGGLTWILIWSQDHERAELWPTSGPNGLVQPKGLGVS